MTVDLSTVSWEALGVIVAVVAIVGSFAIYWMQRRSQNADAATQKLDEARRRSMEVLHENRELLDGMDLDLIDFDRSLVKALEHPGLTQDQRSVLRMQERNLATQQQHLYTWRNNLERAMQDCATAEKDMADGIYAKFRIFNGQHRQLREKFKEDRMRFKKDFLLALGEHEP